MANALRCAAVVAALTVAAAACSSSATDGANASDGASGLPGTELVFNGEGNNLNAYDPATGQEQRVITNADDDPDGRDINAQICFFPDGSGRFVAGEDTGQPELPAGWGIFQLEGPEIGSLSATQVGKLVPTYQPSTDNPENYGCGFLSDGRILTTDVGNQASGEGDGQLIVWFPPFDATQVAYCKVDVGIPTAQQIYVDEADDVYVASARAPGAAIFRYSRFPTSDDATGGCGAVDATGAPLADSVDKEVFIPADDHAATPNGIVPSPAGGFYVSSVLNGVIAEYDEAGMFVRRVLEPPPGESLGEATFSTGTPLGLGIDPAGNVYFADIGLVITPTQVGPGPEGGVRVVRFVDGEPQPPEVLGSGLRFPDGIGIWIP